MTQQPHATDADDRREEPGTGDVYERLARHIGALSMGLPHNDVLVEVLKETLTPYEAGIALLLPTRVAPLQPVSVDDLAATTDIPRHELATVLEDMAGRRLLFAGTTESGERGYALLQSGFGFGEQRFLWDGGTSPSAAKMVEMLGRYFTREVAEELLAADTKPYRYVPVGTSLPPDLQAVFPYHSMEEVLGQAQRFAVAHCPCRVAGVMKAEPCGHPIEVCLKFDELADYLIEAGLGREITRDEAFAIVRQAAEAGLVHFVDNAQGPVKHNCNCCGCLCWNLGPIRRREFARDEIMATYFMRTTDEDACVGCGVCLEICPVQALTLEDEVAVVDEQWCIGCGLCVPRCPTGAAGLVARDDIDRAPAPDFVRLHQQILKEKGLIE